MLQAFRFLAVVAVGGVLVGCLEPAPAPVRTRRLDAVLDSDGYALFHVKPGVEDRTAVLVELRRPAPGTYVLLHSVAAPRSVGWFDLDPNDFAPCRRYGDDEVEDTGLDCLVPDGHGELVDVITIAPEEPAKTAVLRHAFRQCTGWCAADMAPPTMEAHYAVMRIAPDGPPVRFAIETEAVDSAASASFPTVDRLD